MASKIEEMIVELQDYIDGCKNAPFKADSIVVNRDDIESYIEDLRATIPDEIRQYQRIINNQEHILADARKKADAIIHEAEAQNDKLVGEHQIMQQAYARANEVILVSTKEAEGILNKATIEANQIKESAMEYTDNYLKIIQEIIVATMEQTKSKADAYMNQMQGYLDIVTSNRAEITPGIEAYRNTYDNGAPAVNKEEEAPVESVETAVSNNKNDNDDDKKDASSDSGVDVPDVFFNKE